MLVSETNSHDDDDCNSNDDDDDDAAIEAQVNSEPSDSPRFGPQVIGLAREPKPTKRDAARRDATK